MDETVDYEALEELAFEYTGDLNVAMLHHFLGEVIERGGGEAVIVLQHADDEYFDRAVGAETGYYTEDETVEDFEGADLDASEACVAIWVHP